MQDRKFPDINALMTSAIHADNLARSRNVLPKPEPANLLGWDGWTELGAPADIKDYALKPPQLHDGFPKDAAFDKLQSTCATRCTRRACHFRRRR